MLHYGWYEMCMPQLFYALLSTVIENLYYDTYCEDKIY